MKVPKLLALLSGALTAVRPVSAQYGESIQISTSLPYEIPLVPLRSERCIPLTPRRCRYHHHGRVHDVDLHRY
jgi:hypothetical protein